MAVGSLGLWTAVPLGVFWGAATIAKTAVAIYLIALIACPAAMIAWGWGLYRLNGIYLSVTGRTSAEQSIDPGSREVTLLDAFLVVSAIVGIVALLVWWLAFSGSPTSTPWPDEVSGQGG